MKLIEFTDGSSITEFVGKKSAFKDANEFIEKCKSEFGHILEEIDFDIRVEYVVEGMYCRYYPKMPSDMSYLGLESGGYTYCDKGNGSFEVYVIPIRELIAKRSFLKGLDTMSEEKAAYNVKPIENTEPIREGMIIVAITSLLPSLGYSGITIDKIDADIFSNQLILKVSGDCDRYPHSIKPIPVRKAVTGL